MLGELIEESATSLAGLDEIMIHEVGSLSNLSTGFEEIPGFACGAYVGGLSRGAAEMMARMDALEMTARNFGTTLVEALRDYDIRIVPGIGFHGRIFARRKD